MSKIFKRELTIPAADIRAAAAVGGPDVKIDFSSSVQEREVRLMLDNVGLTRLTVSILRLAASFGITYNTVNQVLGPKPVPMTAQASILYDRAEEILKLKNQVVTMFVDNYSSYLDSGMEIKEARKLAFDTVAAHTKARVALIDKLYPDQFDTFLKKNISTKLKIESGQFSNIM